MNRALHSEDSKCPGKVTSTARNVPVGDALRPAVAGIYPSQIARIRRSVLAMAGSVRARDIIASQRSGLAEAAKVSTQADTSWDRQNIFGRAR